MTSRLAVANLHQIAVSSQLIATKMRLKRYRQLTGNSNFNGNSLLPVNWQQRFYVKIAIISPLATAISTLNGYFQSNVNSDFDVIMTIASQLVIATPSLIFFLFPRNNKYIITCTNFVYFFEFLNE